MAESPVNPAVSREPMRKVTPPSPFTHIGTTGAPALIRRMIGGTCKAASANRLILTRFSPQGGPVSRPSSGSSKAACAGFAEPGPRRTQSRLGPQPPATPGRSRRCTHIRCACRQAGRSSNWAGFEPPPRVVLPPEAAWMPGRGQWLNWEAIPGANTGRDLWRCTTRPRS